MTCPVCTSPVWWFLTLIHNRAVLQCDECDNRWNETIE